MGVGFLGRGPEEVTFEQRWEEEVEGRAVQVFGCCASGWGRLSLGSCAWSPDSEGQRRQVSSSPCGLGGLGFYPSPTDQWEEAKPHLSR